MLGVDLFSLYKLCKRYIIGKMRVYLVFNLIEVSLAVLIVKPSSRCEHIQDFYTLSYVVLMI